MARAPRPSSTRGTTDELIKITLDGESVTMSPGDFGARDEATHRVATSKVLGMEVTVTSAMVALGAGTASVDTLAFLWWAARRKQGHPQGLSAILDSFPTIGEMDTRLELEEVTGEDVAAKEDSTPLVSGDEHGGLPLE